MVEVTSYRTGTPAWVDLATSDPAGARAFYGDLLGWEFAIGPDETGNYTMCQLRGRTVAGMVGQPVTNMPTVWTTYMAADDADAVTQRIEAAGGTIMMAPDDVAEQGRLVVATDPTGAVFGVWQARNHLGAQLVNEPGAIVWNELATRDLARAQDFYTAVFDYAWEEVDTGQDGPGYRTFAVGDKTVGGAMGMTRSWPSTIPPHWMPYFAVDDTDATIEGADRLGGAVQVEPTDSPYGRFAVLRDPQGGVFSVIADAATGR